MASTYFSGYSRPPSGVRHYYGDITRVLFVAISVLIGVTVPLSGDVQATALFGVPVIITLVVLAGYTSPHGKAVMYLSALVSAIGLLFAEVIAVASYAANSYLFVVLELISILFLASLYYSVKNVRAIALNKIGKIDGVGEFNEKEFVDSVSE